MKASSCGLETSIRYLTNEQIDKLQSKSIEGVLNFREVMSDKIREISFELKYNPKQRECVEVDLIPDEVYFGKAEKIIFTINQEYYEDLKKEGVASGARFFNAVGKLALYSSDSNNLL